MSVKIAVDVKKFAEMYGLEEQTAYGFCRALADMGVVEIVKRPQPDGKKGKPANTYVFTDDTGPQLGRLILSKFFAEAQKIEEKKEEVQTDREQAVATSTEQTATEQPALTSTADEDEAA